MEIFEDKKYIYSNSLRISNNKNLVILASEKSRKWIKISKECFSILNKFIELDLKHNEMIGMIEDNEDKIYFDKFLKVLYESEILIEKHKTSHRKIYDISLIITDRCNLSCLHCCANSKELKSKDKLSTKNIFEIIDKLVEINPENITISGGEPLIRNDIWEILRYMRSKFNGNIELMTNGLLINQNNINYLKRYVDSISISIDGVDEESCRIIRGNNIFNSVIEKIKFLKKQNFKDVSISAVLPNNQNIHREFEILNEKLQTNPIIRHFSHKGRAGMNHRQIELKMNKYLERRNMNQNRIIQWSEYIPNQRTDIKIGRCGGCETSLTIGSSGEIYPCNLLMDKKYELGNILKINNLEEYIKSIKTEYNKGYKAFVKLKLCDNYKCIDCSVKSFCWSCPAECNDLLGRVEIFEERCNQIKRKLESIVWG